MVGINSAYINGIDSSRSQTDHKRQTYNTTIVYRHRRDGYLNNRNMCQNENDRQIGMMVYFHRRHRQTDTCILATTNTLNITIHTIAELSTIT